MKLECYEIAAALAASSYDKAVDILLAHFGESDNHLCFQITTWSRGPVMPYYSLRLYYYDGRELSWNPSSGFIRGAAYKHMCSTSNGLLGRVVVIA